jgi:hypothetical protein
MIKLVELLPPTNKKHKLFGADAAARVSTSELNAVFKEIQDLIGNSFKEMRLARALPTKDSHGDVDIITLGSPGINPVEVIKQKLSMQMLKFSKNGEINSVLFHSEAINKDVHVDFIYITHANKFESYFNYYSFNDFSGIIGIFAKKIYFKYGSYGFAKRFRDKKGNWHDIPITHDLMKGLAILGYKDAHQKFDSIQDVEDIIKFILESPLFDSKYVTQAEMNQSDRKSMKRPVIDYVVQSLRQANKSASIDDEDYFFKKLLPSQYEKVEKIKSEINDKIYEKSMYNGQWLIDKFGLKPGPQIGQILKSMSDKFGAELNNIPENEVEDFVRTLVHK